MKFLILQHVPFEGPAAIKVWAEKNCHQLAHHYCPEQTIYPPLNSFDAVIIMGGPMGVNQPLPWLQPELAFIQQIIAAKKQVLGICLGAQLIAKALGAQVSKHHQREIGWFNVKQTTAANNWVHKILPPTFMPLHWHGDSFEIPPGAVHLYHSPACSNQAYLYDQHVLGLQFHLEFDRDTAIRVADACSDELQEGGLYVQSANSLLADQTNFKNANALMFNLLNAIELRINR
jgi:GMP synthase-like glutamine amidotransferase